MEGKGGWERDLDRAGSVVDGVGGREVTGAGAHAHGQRFGFGVVGVLLGGPGGRLLKGISDDER